MVRRALASVAFLTALACAGPAGASAAACPNEAFRSGPGAGLPDCRAYEQVSPVDKNNGEISYGPSGASASPMTPSPAAPSGDLVTFSSFNAFAGNPSAPMVSQYLARRDASGWSTQGISPPKLPPFAGVDTRTGYVGFSRDLAHLALINWAAPGQYSLFLRNPDGALTKIADTPPAPPAIPPAFLGATPDFSHILVGQNEPAARLWLWKDGQLSRISGEGGTPSNGGAGGSSGIGGNWGRPISDDGSRIFWTPSQSSEPLYVYEEGVQTPYTVSECDTGKVGEPGPGGNCAPAGDPVPGAEMWTASADGEAFFTSRFELTDDANTGTANQGSDLYRYGTDGRLADLTADPDDPNGAEVEGLLGASDDGDYVYFVAKGVLAEGATAGALNLYAWHDGETAFGGVLADAPKDRQNWIRNSNPLAHSTSTQVSAEGSDLIFTSTAPTSQLVPGSSFDNAGHLEVYLFDADAGAVTCVSCNPNGGVAAGDAGLGQSRAALPAVSSTYRNITADGSRVYFETPDALLPQDVNGVGDVYQWQRPGTGSCPALDADGCLALISTGHSPQPSFFQSISSSADDIFFLTREQLVGQDIDTLNDLYDARVGGGLAGQYPPAPAPPCQGEACRGPVDGGSPPPTPGSTLLHAEGNARTDCSSFAVRARRLRGSAGDLRRRARLVRRLAARSEGGRSARKLRRRAARLQARARSRGKQAKRFSQRAKQCRRAARGVSK